MKQRETWVSRIDIWVIDSLMAIESLWLLDVVARPSPVVIRR